MKKTFLILTASLIVSIIFISCGGGNSVTIGEQVWMNENLNTTTFQDGTTIPEAKSDEEWIKAGKEGKPAWCYKNYKTEDPNIGRVYNWYAVSDKRGLAPKGWHVATNSDWNTLLAHVGNSDAATKLKSKEGWKSSQNECQGTNEVGFNALPCGGRGGDPFAFPGYVSGYWWTASSSSAEFADFRQFSCKIQNVTDGEFDKWVGMRVRCVKDK